MQATSPFVEQMFKLADKDCNGYISFREFLDIMFIFAKGTPEDKLKLYFDMYDVTGEGKLDREAFKKMMRSFMDVVSASVDPTNLDELVDSMFKTEDGEEKEFLYFEDFGSIMMDLDKKDGLLSDVNNVFKGATDTITSCAKSPKRKCAKNAGRAKNAMDTESLTRKRKYGTVVKKDSRLGATSPPIEAASPGRTDFTLAQKVNIDYSPYLIRQWITLTRYIENHRQHIFILTFYTLLVIGAFIEKAYAYSVLKEFSGLRRVAGYGVSVSRGAAAAMTLTFSTLLLTMSRNTLTFLRETQAMNWIPFDSAIAFHKYVAFLALFFTVVHTIGHAMNFYHFSTQSATALTCLFRNDFHRSHILPSFTHYCWGTVTGLSGVLLCVVIAVLYVFATQYSRRVVFKFFWWTHQLYFALYALTIIHGSGHLLQPPGFHVFLIGPAVLFTIDKLISMARKKVEIPVVKAELLPSDVTNLQFKRPVNFNYKSGQWVRIACLDLGGSEYHPFTLTSAPHEENLSLHIRAVGPWTINLRSTYNKDNLQDRPFPKLYLDGPFGEGHQDWYRYEVSVLVGGGIGVTPFASILKDIAHKGTLKSTFACKQ
ncbi:dual oxidase 1 precursor, partial [Paramuricea clavata]